MYTKKGIHDPKINNYNFFNRIKKKTFNDSKKLAHSVSLNRLPLNADISQNQISFKPSTFPITPFPDHTPKPSSSTPSQSTKHKTTLQNSEQSSSNANKINLKSALAARNQEKPVAEPSAMQ